MGMECGEAMEIMAGGLFEYVILCMHMMYTVR